MLYIQLRKSLKDEQNERRASEWLYSRADQCVNNEQRRYTAYARMLNLLYLTTTWILHLNAYILDKLVVYSFPMRASFEIRILLAIVCVYSPCIKTLPYTERHTLSLSSNYSARLLLDYEVPQKHILTHICPTSPSLSLSSKILRDFMISSIFNYRLSLILKSSILSPASSSIHFYSRFERGIFINAVHPQKI